MANTTSAKKATRKIARRTIINKSRRTQMRGAVRTVEEAIKSGDRDAALKAMAHAEPELMQAAQRNIIHKNNASRKVSRLAHQIAKLAKLNNEGGVKAGQKAAESMAKAQGNDLGNAWLKQNIPVITQSVAYKEGGAIFIVWDEGEDSGKFSDGPIGMFVLSPFAKGGGTKAYSNSIHYDHSSLLKTIQEIFKVKPLLGAAADAKTKDLSDLFQ